jgi:hypothetical protein
VTTLHRQAALLTLAALFAGSIGACTVARLTVPQTTRQWIAALDAATAATAIETDLAVRRGYVSTETGLTIRNTLVVAANLTDQARVSLAVDEQADVAVMLRQAQESLELAQIMLAARTTPTVVVPTPTLSISKRPTLAWRRAG